jgi:transglutaminase-like putative cysteine protease
LPSGKPGTIQTLKFMRSLVREFKKHPIVRNITLQLIADLPQKDFAGEVDAIFDFVQNDIRYVKDTAGVETVQTPLKTLELAAGDCDDKTTLLNAMLEAIGFPTRFVAIGPLKNYFSHVYADVLLDGDWLSLETTEPWPLGKSPRSYASRIIVYNSGNERAKL